LTLGDIACRELSNGLDIKELAAAMVPIEQQPLEAPAPDVPFAAKRRMRDQAGGFWGAFSAFAR